MVLVKKIIPVCLGMIMLFDMCINVSADNQKNQILDINSTISMLSNNSYYIKSKVNLGFSGGNNYGIEIAKKECNPDYYLLLNNDTVVQKDFLTKLVETAERHTNAGIVCGKIYYYSNPTKVWFAGGTFNSKLAVADHINYNMIDNIKNMYEKEIEFATGCLLLLPKKTIDIVGLLDETFFLYAEDTDYSRRVRNENMKIVYRNDAIIYHKVSIASRNGDNISYYMIRNNLYIVKKYASNKFLAYLNASVVIIKQIVKCEIKISIAARAIKDFIFGIYGERQIKG